MNVSDTTNKAPAGSAARRKAGTRFARPADAPAESPDAAVPASDLLERLEAQAERLSQARLRGRQLERVLRSQIEKRERLEAELEQEREHSAQLAAELARRYDEVRASESAEREVEELELAVRGLEQELDSTRMQLDAVRSELVAKRPLSQRLHPRSWR